VEESLALFATHLGIGIAEDEADGGEEVTLARAISADNNIGARRERLENGLVLIAALVLACARPRRSKEKDGASCAPFKALDDNLLDIHRDNWRRCLATADSKAHTNECSSGEGGKQPGQERRL